MTRFFIFIVLASLCTLAARAQVPDFGSETYVLDFTKSHTMNEIQKSGIPYRKDIGQTAMFQAYSFSNKEVLIKLPDGRQFKQRVATGTVDVMNGKIQEFETRGLIMPHDQVYEVAKSTLVNLGLSLGKLNEWNEQNRGKYPDAANFSMSNTALYPAVGISIMTTFSDVYPWCVMLKLSWNLPSQKDWTEERAEKENAPPPVGSETVSLEPPSGKTYDIRDSFPKVRAEQAAHEKAYYEKHPTNAQPQATVTTPTPQPESQKTEPPPVASTENQSSSHMKIIVLIVLAVVVIGGIALFRRKPKE